MKSAFVLSLLLFVTSAGFSAPTTNVSRMQPAAAAKSGVEAWKLGLLGLAVASFLIRRRL